MLTTAGSVGDPDGLLDKATVSVVKTCCLALLLFAMSMKKHLCSSGANAYCCSYGIGYFVVRHDGQR